MVQVFLEHEYLPHRLSLQIAGAFGDAWIVQDLDSRGRA
jgi:hypothetical protein